MLVSQRLHSYNFVIILTFTNYDMYMPSIMYIPYLITWIAAMTSVNGITPSILLDSASLIETIGNKSVQTGDWFPELSKWLNTVIKMD